MRKKILPIFMLIALIFSFSQNLMCIGETTPNITFEADDEYDTIIVTSINNTNVSWSDIDIVGSCNLSNIGAIVGIDDQITDCVGDITISYIPTNTTLFSYSFTESEVTPSISFSSDDVADTITVISVSQTNIVWSDISIIGSCNIEGLGTTVETNDQITNCSGILSLTYIPTNTILLTVYFTEAQDNDNTSDPDNQTIPSIPSSTDDNKTTTPSVNFSWNEEDRIITVSYISIDDIAWNDVLIEGNCSKSNIDDIVSVGDTITQCFGRIKIYYKPTGGLLGIFEFSSQSTKIDKCWIYGTVYEKTANFKTPIENATVFYKKYSDNYKNINQSWNVKNSDGNGSYLIKVNPGTYTLHAGKRQIRSSNIIINIKAGERFKQDFILNDTGVIPVNVSDEYLDVIKDYNYSKINQAINNGSLGGEITIWRDENELISHEILIYENLEIDLISIGDQKINFSISGDDNITGKTIVITVDKSIIDNIYDFAVEYDGELIKMAKDINDILNSNDDGSHPEYLISIGANSTQIIVSIPHFSEHYISFYSLIEEKIEEIGGITVLLYYVSICIIASVIFIGSIILRRKI